MDTVFRSSRPILFHTATDEKRVEFVPKIRRTMAVDEEIDLEQSRRRRRQQSLAARYLRHDW